MGKQTKGTVRYIMLLYTVKQVSLHLSETNDLPHVLMVKDTLVNLEYTTVDYTANYTFYITFSS